MNVLFRNSYFYFIKMNSFRDPLTVSFDSGNASAPKTIISENEITTNIISVAPIGTAKIVKGRDAPDNVTVTVDMSADPKTFTITNGNSSASYSLISYAHGAEVQKKVVTSADCTTELFENCLTLTFTTETNVTGALNAEEVASFDKLTIHDEINDMDLLRIYFKAEGSIMSER